MEAMLSFAVVAALLVISPGPNLVLIMNTGIRSGRIAGLLNAIGIALAFYAHGALAIYGLEALLTLVPSAYLALKIIGAVYLIWLGMKALRQWNEDVRLDVDENPGRQRQAFVEGFMTNLLNPKVSAFYMAAFPVFMTTQQFDGAQAFKLVAIHSVISLLWFSSVALLLVAFRHRLQALGLFRWLKLMGGMAMVFFGIRLLSWKPREAVQP